MRLAIDFDGTIVEHQFPKIGPLNPEAEYWLQEWQAAGAELFLWTVRDGQYLEEALAFCRAVGIEFKHANVDPNQKQWNSSPKLYAEYYIDDLAFGAPVRPTDNPPYRPMVDWRVIGPRMLLLLKNKRKKKR